MYLKLLGGRFPSMSTWPSNRPTSTRCAKMSISLTGSNDSDISCISMQYYYVVFPLPVGPMIAFIPGRMRPLQGHVTETDKPWLTIDDSKPDVLDNAFLVGWATLFSHTHSVGNAMESEHRPWNGLHSRCRWLCIIRMWLTWIVMFLSGRVTGDDHLHLIGQHGNKSSHLTRAKKGEQ